jgi:iron complex transport system substrate-binding protein
VLSFSLAPRFLRLSAIALLVSLGLGGCQPGSYSTSQEVTSGPVAPLPPLESIDWLEDPKSYQGPSTALSSTAALEPLGPPAPEPQLPTTVVSNDLDGDISVTIERAERIIAVDLSGSLAQTLWGLGYGDRLVGRDISTLLPGTEDLPVVTGSGHSISPEAILELAPDLVITDGTVGPIDVMLQLRQAGITLVFIREPAGLDQPAAQARRVAEALGVPTRGDELAVRINEQIEEIRLTIDLRVPARREDRLRMVFLYLRGASGIYYLFGQESGAGDLIEALGGIDVAAEIGWTGLRPVTDEALIEANPDLILVMSGGLDSVGGVDQLLRDKPAIALTAAGANRRIVDMADNEVLGFGPRTPLVLDALARAIYAPER